MKTLFTYHGFTLVLRDDVAQLLILDASGDVLERFLPSDDKELAVLQALDSMLSSFHTLEDLETAFRAYVAANYDDKSSHGPGMRYE